MIESLSQLIARRIGWRQATGGVICLALTVPPAVLAQQTPDTEEPRLEEIVITGTRVRGVSGPVGSAVIGIGREEIEATSEVNITNLLREVPQVLNLGVTDVTRSTSGGNGNISYGNAANLRGLGPFSTLTLVNGHRVPINARNFEPDSIAMLGIERVEIVPDGASAVYGSDAVAGVINLVLRRDVDGGQVMARYGAADGYDERRLGVSWGTTWEAGQFFLAYENSNRSNLSGDDRDFFGAGLQVTQCDPGNIVIDGVSYAIPQGGITQAEAASLVPGTQNTCSNVAGVDIRPKQTQNNVLFTFNQSISDRIEFHADAFYSERDTILRTGWANSDLNVPSTNAFFVDPTGTATTSVVRYEMRDWPVSGLDVPLGARHQQLAAGLVIGLGGNWEFEVLAHHGKANDWSKARSNINNAALNAALASSDPATAFDPYGLHRTSQAVLDQIRSAVFVADNEMVFRGGELLFSGPLFDIAGRAVQFAGGYERQDYRFSPSLARGPAGSVPACVPCNVAGVGPPLKRAIDSFFAEVILPLGPADARLGRSVLELRAALRHDNYSDVGDTTNPQLGFNWAPADALTVRGSWGTSFRAPIIPDLFGNSSAFFVEPFPDPTQGGANVTGVARSGGNPNLVPEEATTWTLGVDWRPDAIPGLDLGLTYFNVDYTGQIQQYLGDRVILFREALFAGTNIIRRGAEAEQWVADEMAQGTPVVGVLPDPLPVAIDGRPQNLGKTRMEGVDFQFRYFWNNSTGSYTANLGGTYVSKYEEAQTPAAPLLNRNNSVYGPKRWRGRGGLGWNRNAYSARVAFNYTGAYRNNFTAEPEDVDSFVTVDLSGSIRIGETGGASLGDGWVASLEIRNLFDSDPRSVNLASYGFDPTAHDPMGRVMSVSLRKSF